MKLVLIGLLSVFISCTAFAHPGHGHLEFSGANLHAHLSWLKAPVDDSEAVMQLEWHDATTHAIVEPNLPFSVELYMPSMGHGSAPTKIGRAVDDRGNIILGTYRVNNMYFIMPGEWEVRVKVKYSDGSEEMRAWKLTIGGEDGGGHHH